MYDFIIVGAGPAGATLARLLAKNCRVLLLDRRQLDKPCPLGQKEGLEKCCGGLIAPDAQQMLAKMGLGVPRDVLVGPQLFTVRTIDIKNRLERHYQRHYINIDRERFDSWLVSLLPSGIDIRWASSFKNFEIKHNEIQVRFLWQGKEHQAITKFLIGADGATSTVRRGLRPEIEPRKYISIQEWFKVKKNTAYYSAIFDRDITDFYSWTIPKEDYLLVGSALIPHEKAPERFELLKQKLDTFGFELGERVKRNGAYILRPANSGQICYGQENVLLIGEAAGWISPTSAEGLSYAFRSALALAQSLREEPSAVLSRYRKHTANLKRNIILKNAKAPFMFQPSLRELALRSGLMSIDIEQ